MGRYSQAPTPRQVLKGTDGNPDLRTTWALHSSVGVVQRVGDAWTIEATAFDHQLRDLVSGREDAFRFFTGPPPVGPLDTGEYANDGTGVSRGVETLVKLRTDDTVAWLSATVSRSTRTKRPGQDPRLFTYDQPLVVTAVGTHRFGEKWRLGGRARYASGIPYTKVVNRVYDLDSRAFEPVYGEINGDRLPAFAALDVRVDRTWTFRKWELTAYLDVQNVTSRNNVEWMSWSFDYEREEPITTYPILPVIGVRGQW